MELLTEHDGLLHIVRPNLLAMYQTRLGPWELRLLEMAQAALNASRLPILAEIETKLAEEFALWEERMREAAAKVEAAGYHLAHLMTPNESKEFKELYHKLVKALHPDVAAANDEQTRMLWHSVQNAYENSDLEAMKELLGLADQLVPTSVAPNSLEALKAAGQALRNQIERLSERIAQLRAPAPVQPAGKAGGRGVAGSPTDRDRDPDRGVAGETGDSGRILAQPDAGDQQWKVD